MKDLLETSLSIGLAIALIAMVYSLLGNWLRELVSQSFTQIPQ